MNDAIPLLQMMKEKGLIVHYLSYFNGWRKKPDQGTFNSTTIGHVQGICKIKRYYQN